MVSHQQIVIAAALLLASNVSAADHPTNNPIVMSMADQIVSGLVDARKSGVSEDKASSECNEIMTALMQDKNINGMLNDAAHMVISGINSDGFTSFVSGALKSLSNFENSDNFKTADDMIKKSVKDLNTDKAIPSVSSAISPVLNLVTPTIGSMSKTDKNVASAANTGLAAGKSVLQRLEIIPKTGSDSSATGTAGSTTSKTGSASSSTKTGTITSSASSSASGSSTGSQTSSTGAAQQHTVAGIAFGGLAAGAALLL